MPLIQVKLIEGVFTETQKRQMVQKLTDAMITIEGESMRSVTWVIVEEVKSGNWGIGGKAMTAADVKGLAAGKPLGLRAEAGGGGPRPRVLRGPARPLHGLGSEGGLE